MRYTSFAVLAGVLVSVAQVGLATPAAAQQFSFLTGDRAMQGYGANVRASNDGQRNDGTQGGGAVAGPLSPYQANFAATGATGTQGNSAGPDGGVGGRGAVFRTTDGNPTGMGGGRFAALGDGRASQATTGSGPTNFDGAGGTGATGSGGGKQSAVIGPAPGGLNATGIPPLGGVGGYNVSPATSAPAQFATVVPPTTPNVPLGCPPACGPAGGGNATIKPIDSGRLNTFANAGNTGGAGGRNSGMGAGPNLKTYDFKFNTPMSTVQGAGQPPVPPMPAVKAATVVTPAVTGVQLKTLQNVPNLHSLNNIRTKN